MWITCSCPHMHMEAAEFYYVMNGEGTEPIVAHALMRAAFTLV